MEPRNFPELMRDGKPLMDAMKFNDELPGDIYVIDKRTMKPVDRFNFYYIIMSSYLIQCVGTFP